MAGKWDPEVIHGTFDDQEVTLKSTFDGSEVLVSRDHLDDIQRDVDHVHAWNQGTDQPDHHEMRWSEPLFDSQDGEEPAEPVA